MITDNREIIKKLEEAFYAGDIEECRELTHRALKSGANPFDLIIEACDCLRYGILLCYCLKKTEKKLQFGGDRKECNSDVKLVFSLFNAILNAVTSTMRGKESSANTMPKLCSQKITNHSPLLD